MRLRGQFSLLASIGLSFSIGLIGCSSESQHQVLPVGSTVIALGDSLTYGYGASTETAYPSVLADLSQWEVVNAGANGDTSGDVLARIESITKQSPDLVLRVLILSERLIPYTLQILMSFLSLNHT